MLKPIRLIFTAAALLVGLIILWHWRDLRASRPANGEDAGIPTRPWAEIASSGSGNSARYGDPQQIGTLTARELREVSGITPGRTVPGVWWVHNDSGDQARLYAISSDGKLLASFEVTGAKNEDWEDIASGPGPDSSPALYLADVGDNDLERDDLVVYRVKEPQLSEGKNSGSTELAEAFPFRYPDGRHNAEAIFVDPESGRIYIVTKMQTEACGVYRFPMPLRPGRQVTLEAVEGTGVGEISRMRLVTGAAASADGSRVAIRTYFGAIELQRAKGGAFETIFNATPEIIRLPIERQGEAIAYTADGKSLVTTSERLPAPIYRMTRRE
jgi:hypothetical protein